MAHNEEGNPGMESLLKEGRRADVEDKEFAEAMQGLMKAPGWPLYEAKLTQMIEARGEQIMSPAGSVDGAIALEHVKGTMMGLLLARNLPAVTIAAMKNLTPAKDNDDAN